MKRSRDTGDDGDSGADAAPPIKVVVQAGKAPLIHSTTHEGFEVAGVQETEAQRVSVALRHLEAESAKVRFDAERAALPGAASPSVVQQLQTGVEHLAHARDELQQMLGIIAAVRAGTHVQPRHLPKARRDAASVRRSAVVRLEAKRHALGACAASLRTAAQTCRKLCEREHNRFQQLLELRRRWTLCVRDGQASVSFGAMFGHVKLSVDPATGDVACPDSTRVLRRCLALAVHSGATSVVFPAMPASMHTETSVHHALLAVFHARLCEAVFHSAARDALADTSSAVSSVREHEVTLSIGRSKQVALQLAPAWRSAVCSGTDVRVYQTLLHRCIAELVSALRPKAKSPAPMLPVLVATLKHQIMLRRVLDTLQAYASVVAGCRVSVWRRSDLCSVFALFWSPRHRIVFLVDGDSAFAADIGTATPLRSDALAFHVESALLAFLADELAVLLRSRGYHVVLGPQSVSVAQVDSPGVRVTLHLATRPVRRVDRGERVVHVPTVSRVSGPGISSQLWDTVSAPSLLPRLDLLFQLPDVQAALHATSLRPVQ